MTPQQWKEKTLADIALRRNLKAEGERQAENYCFENMNKVKRRINK